jgi:NAD(P)-dependent dehydrogenase (short-subunit alcohol dehydrogenase family)
MGLLEGKVAVVTGGGRGIGRGIARAFTCEGGRVAVVDIDKDTAATTAAELSELGASGLAVQCDVSSRDQVDDCVGMTLDAFGQIDILVNAAIAGAPVVPLVDTTEALIASMWESGPLGTFNMMQACYLHLRDRHGAIINFGSAAGINGVAGYGAYAPAKEAVRSLSKVAAREWARDGIRVNVICPHANSPLAQEWAAADPDRAARTYAAIPLGRIGDCEQDIGSAAVFLASHLSSYVTGHTLILDGGGYML